MFNSTSRFQQYQIMRILIVALALLSLLMITNQQQDIVFQQQIIETEQPIIPEAPIQPEPIPQAHIPIQRQPFKFDLVTFKRYRYQVLGISLIFLYFILFIRGKSANLAIMQKFYRRVDTFLENNFAHIGFSKQSGEVPFNGESPSESLYYATGRENVDGIQMKFNTKKRHDLLYLLYDIIFPEKDTVTIDIPVKTQIPLVFALASKKKVKQMAENYLDIKKMTGKFKISNLNEYYEVLGESSDTLDSIIDNYVTKRLNDMQGLFISIHYTDLKTFTNTAGHLRVILNATHKNPDQFLPGMELIFYLVDKIASLKLTANSKARALKAREAYNQLKEKEELQKHNEQLRKKKEEKLRQEEAWIRSLPPEKQKREEQKRKKKELNKLMKGKVMKM